MGNWKYYKNPYSVEVIWRFHWDALGCHSWAPNKLHCWISTAHMEALCERKSFPAPAENLASQFCFQSHSYSFCFSVSFLMFFFFWVSLCWSPFFMTFIGSLVLITWSNNLVSCEWQVTDYSMEEDKKSFLFVFICLSQRFWHLLAISCDLSCLCTIMN